MSFISAGDLLWMEKQTRMNWEVKALLIDVFALKHMLQGGLHGTAHYKTLKHNIWSRETTFKMKIEFEGRYRQYINLRHAYLREKRLMLPSFNEEIRSVELELLRHLFPTIPTTTQENGFSRESQKNPETCPGESAPSPPRNTGQESSETTPTSGLQDETNSKNGTIDENRMNIVV